MRLQSERRAITKRSQSDCIVNVKRLQKKSKEAYSTIAELLQSYRRAIAERRKESDKQQTYQ
jgi:hypothetical protein